MLDIALLTHNWRPDKLTVAVLGSHSALEVCQGAKQAGLNNLVIAQKGREQTYARHYRTHNGVGCVDQCVIVERFADILKPEVVKQLQACHGVFVPHRSFEVYLNFAYSKIENDFPIPIFGNRYLLKIEERSRKPNQYDLLQAAGIRFPRQFHRPREIDRLCLVKVLEADRGFERAFFLAGSSEEFRQVSQDRLKRGIFTPKQLNNSVIEEFIVGVHVNFNYFYSPLERRLELLGTDTRRQTNFEGLIRTPAVYQEMVSKTFGLKYEEAGHIAVTVTESMLEDAFAVGERFVAASQKLCPPGIIGPFALQAVIVPGPPKKEIVVVDVSPRMPGSPGIAATPYSGYLFGRSVSVGERLSIELKTAARQQVLTKVLT